MKHRSNILTRMLSVTLAVSMLFDLNGMTALAESADALSGADSYAVEADATKNISGVAEEAFSGAVESAGGNAVSIEGTTAGTDQSGTGDAEFETLFLEPESVDAQAYAYLGVSEDSDAYQVDTSLGYKAAGIDAVPGRNSADILYYVNKQMNDAVYVIYAENGTENDFFPGTTFTTDISAYQSAYKSYSYIGKAGNTITLNNLKGNTAYIYRLALRQGNSTDGYTWYFLSKPACFTVLEDMTESSIEIKDVAVGDYGYTSEIVWFSIDNPQNEAILFMDVADEGCLEENSQNTYYSRESGTDSAGNAYETYGYKVRTNEGNKEIRVAVQLNGKVAFVRQAVELKHHDMSELQISLSEGGSDSVHWVRADASRLYDVDGSEGMPELHLYYREQGGTGEYTGYTETISSYNGGASCSFSGSAGKSYEYYAEVTGADGNVISGATIGSADYPKVFTVPEDYENKTYTYDDFTDKTLFYCLVLEGKHSSIWPAGDGWKELTLNKQDLERKGYLQISYTDWGGQTVLGGTALPEADGVGVIESLDDLDKMPNLESVSLQGQGLTDISKLTELQNLRRVDLRYNNIAELPDLSGCKWTELDLSNNLLTEKAINAAKLPEKLEADVGDQESNILTLGDDVYPDLYVYQGKRQLYFTYRYGCYQAHYADRDKVDRYTFTVTANGQTSGELSAKYDGADYYIEDIGIELMPGKKYPATIKVLSFGKELLSQDVTLCYALKGNSPAYYIARQDLVPNGQTAIYASLYYGYDVTDIKAFYLLNHSTGEQKAESTAITKGGASTGYHGNSFFNIYQESYGFSGTFELYDVPDGNYDLKVEFADGESCVFEDYVYIVTDTITIIKYAGVETSDYDSTGEYCYICLSTGGYDLETEKLWPVLTSEDGSKVYTKKVWGKHRDSGNTYVYKLLKKDNWSEIDTSDFNTILNVRLETAEGYVVRDARETTTIYVSSLCDSRLKTCYYNLKRGVFEYFLTQDVPEGAYVEGRLYTKQNDESSLFAVAEGTVDADHHIVLTYKTADGGAYTPSYAEAGTIYHQLFIPGFNRFSTSTTSSTSATALRLSGVSSYAAGQSSLNVSAYCTSGQAETDELYVRLSDAEGAVLATTPEILQYYPKGSYNDSYDYYRNPEWNLGQELVAGTYTLTLYGMADGEERVYATQKIYVVGDGFWQDSQSVTYHNYQNTEWQEGVANISIHLPGLAAEAMDAKGAQNFWTEHKLSLTVCNADGEVQEVSVTPYRVTAAGYLYLTVSNLDEDADGYYFKLTKDGVAAQNPATAEAYYSDVHGVWAARRKNAFFSGDTYDKEYKFLGVSGYAGDLAYTIEIYKRGNLDEAVKTLTVARDDLNYNGYYYFTEEDLEGLYSDEMYYLIATSAVGNVYSATGFLPAKETAPDNGGDGDGQEKVQHQIQFYVGDTVYKTLTVKDGEVADMTEIAAPTPAEGQGEFEGWCISGTENLWDATQPVTADLKLEAHFKVDGNTGGNGGEGGNSGEENPATIQHQIQFYVGDTVYKTLSVKEGDTADMAGVAAPTPAEGQGEFEGWYISGTETLWDASQPVSADLKLEARFKTAGDGDNGGNPGEGGTGTEGDNTEPGESALDVEVNVSAEKGSLYLVKGQKFNLGNGTWISSDPKSLAISKKNEATAKKDAEGITIKATDVNKEYTVSIVTPKLSEVKCTVLVGDDSKTLSVTGLGTNNKYASNYAVYWTSASPEIVTVDDGKLHAMSKGTATVTAYVNGKAYNCKVSVVDAMSIGKLGANASFTLTPMQTTALKFDSGFKLKKAVEWTSTVDGAAVGVTPVLKKNGKVDYYENGIVKITTAGKVTAIGAGTTTLTAKDASGNTQTFTVTVSEPAVKTLYVNQGSTKTVKLYNVKASALQFKAIGGAGKAELTNGRLQGITTGEVTLSAAYIPCNTQTGKGFTYTLEVYVEDPFLNTGNGLTQKSGLNYNLTLKKGEKYSIEEKAVYQPVLYKSSKAAVAFVNESGIISARSVGKAKITAKVNGKKVTINVTVTE